MSRSGGWVGLRVLVTGGAGAIGSQLCRRLEEAGARVVVVDDFSAGARWNVPEVIEECVDGDILDETVLGHLFGFRPEVVLHLAAQFANERSIQDPERDLMVNGLGTLRLIRWARLSKVHRFVYLSSSSVYGPRSSLPLSEGEESVEPGTPYQATKLLGEHYVNDANLRGEMLAVILRVFNSYGPGEVPRSNRNVIARFAYAALTGRDIVIQGTGDETRDFTYVDDVVSGIMAAALSDRAAGQTINLGTGIETRIEDVAAMIRALAGSLSAVRYVPRRTWDRTDRRVADVTRARKILGWESRWTLELGLLETLRWLEANRRRIEELADAVAVSVDADDGHPTKQAQPSGLFADGRPRYV